MPCPSIEDAGSGPGFDGGLLDVAVRFGELVAVNVFIVLCAIELLSSPSPNVNLLSLCILITSLSLAVSLLHSIHSPDQVSMIQTLQEQDINPMVMMNMQSCTTPIEYEPPRFVLDSTPPPPPSPLWSQYEFNPTAKLIQRLRSSSSRKEVKVHTPPCPTPTLKRWPCIGRAI